MHNGHIAGQAQQVPGPTAAVIGGPLAVRAQGLEAYRVPVVVVIIIVIVVFVGIRITVVHVVVVVVVSVCWVSWGQSRRQAGRAGDRWRRRRGGGET
jgi:hypothetical protein